MKEKELQKLVMQELKTNGWNAAHFGNSVKFVKRGSELITIPDKDATGFPDICATRDGELLFIELKSEKGRIRDEQALWIADLRTCALESRSVRVFVWYPKDWESGEITRAVSAKPHVDADNRPWAA